MNENAVKIIKESRKKFPQNELLYVTVKPDFDSSPFRYSKLAGIVHTGSGIRHDFVFFIKNDGVDDILEVRLQCNSVDNAQDTSIQFKMDDTTWAELYYLFDVQGSVSTKVEKKNVKRF